MPQRVNAKADIGNSKIASDAYDTNNIFLTDQGWVYRHWKGEPSAGRFWDEILVAGQVDPDNAAVASTDVTPTTYSTTGGGNEYYPATPPWEPNAAGTPDAKFDVQYSEHTEDGTAWTASGPDQYDFDAMRDADDNVIPPPLKQFPEVEGYETPGVTPTP